MEMVIEEIRLERYAEYKDSGVEWIGEAPEQWEIRRLKYIFKIQKRIAGQLGHSVLSITQNGIKVKDTESGEGQLSMDYSKYQLVHKGDFAMNHMDLLTGYVDISEFNGVISPDYRVFELADKNSNNKYMLLLLQLCYKTKVFYAHGQGVSMLGRWRFPTENFNAFLFPIPSLKEQIAIAEFLDQKTALIDQAIAIKERQIELLKERRQILIHNAVTRGLNPDVKMKDSGVEWIGEIPEHWEVKRVKYITTKIGSGVTPSGGGSTYLESGIPLLRSQNILFGKIDFEGAAFISSKTHHSMGNSQVRKGDVLLNVTGGSIGRCHYVETDVELNVNQHVCIVRPSALVTSIFLNSVLASEVGQTQIWFNQQGGGREGLNFQAIKNFTVPLPPPKEQITISRNIEAVAEKFNNTLLMKEKEIEKLKEYKATLINSAVTGKIKVG